MNLKPRPFSLEKRPAGPIIRPITDAAGPITRLADIAERVGIDPIIRAIAAGLPVYDAGNALLARRAEFDLLREAGEGSR